MSSPDLTTLEPVLALSAAIAVPVVTALASLWGRWSVPARFRLVRRLEDVAPTFRLLCRLFNGRGQSVSTRWSILRFSVLAPPIVVLILMILLPNLGLVASVLGVVGVAALFGPEWMYFRKTQKAIGGCTNFSEADAKKITLLLGRHNLISGEALFFGYLGFLAPLRIDYSALASSSLIVVAIISEALLVLAVPLFLTSYLDSRTCLYDLAYTQYVGTAGHAPVEVEVSTKTGGRRVWSGQILRVRNRLAILTKEKLVVQLDWADIDTVAVSPEHENLESPFRPRRLVKLWDEEDGAN